jgi:hypothetical protein
MKKKGKKQTGIKIKGERVQINEKTRYRNKLENAKNRVDDKNKEKG